MIGFDVCQEGNSFSPGLLRYPHISLLRPSDPVKISLFMWYGVAPPPPPLTGPLIGVLSVLYIHQGSEGVSDGHDITLVQDVDHGREAGLDMEGGVEV